jgi:hypothetical protein
LEEDNMVHQISLNLYNEEDEIIKTVTRSASKLKFGFLKRAVKLQSKVTAMNQDNMDEMFDLVAEFVVSFFGDEITVKEIEDGATPGEVFAVLKEIVSCANGFSGPENFQ